MITFKTAHDLTSKLVRSREFWAIFILSAIAFGLRFYRLGANDLWYDEVYSVLISRDSLAIWNPPVYFIILHYWIKLFGTSEFALRFPSLVFSVLSIPMLYILGKMIFDRRAGFYAGLIMCLSSFHIWYAQEARPYSLSVFLSILTTYYLFRFLKEGKLVQGGLYAFFTVAGIYSDISHYYLFLLLIQLLAAVIFIKKNLYLRLFLVLCGVSLISALRLEFFISKFLYIKDGFWIPSPSLRSLIFTLENFNSGYNVPAWLYRFSDILVLAILAWSFVNYRKAQGKTMGLIVAGMLSFLPLGLAYVFSKVFFPIYLERAFIIFSPYYYLLIGFGINYISDRRMKIFILVSFLVISFAGLSGYYRNLMPMGAEHHNGVTLKKPFKPALRFIEDNFRNGDILMHTNSSPREIFGFYSRRKEIRQNFLFASQMIDSDWRRPYKPGLGVFNVDDLEYVNPRRVWVVSCDWQRGKKMDRNSEAVNSEMSGRYKLDLSLEFDGLRVYRYLNLQEPNRKRP